MLQVDFERRHFTDPNVDCFGIMSRVEVLQRRIESLLEDIRGEVTPIRHELLDWLIDSAETIRGTTTAGVSDGAGFATTHVSELCFEGEQSEGTIILKKIAGELRERLPIDAVAPTERIFYPTSGSVRVFPATCCHSCCGDIVTLT